MTAWLTALVQFVHFVPFGDIERRNLLQGTEQYTQKVAQKEVPSISTAAGDETRIGPNFTTSRHWSDQEAPRSTLPPRVKLRANIEGLWLGNGVLDHLAAEGEKSSTRPYDTKCRFDRMVGPRMYHSLGLAPHLIPDTDMNRSASECMLQCRLTNAAAGRGLN
ncbi:hypothetical protein DFH09DRAFT_1073488 [Mycena vulgaris]|nr:hypothetical protein DFH09DRAFT_1073488 [Mycena vulgaris]